MNKTLFDEQMKSYKELIKQIDALNRRKEMNKKRREKMDEDNKIIDSKLRDLYAIKANHDKAFEGFNQYLQKYNTEDDSSV